MSEANAAVRLDIDGPVLIITLSRPEVLNAVNTEMSKQLSAAIRELDHRSDLRVGVITGAGGNFCAGMDLKAFAQGERPFLEEGGFAGLVEKLPTKPLIAAVEGYALAGGFEIVLSCDMLVASRNAQFGLPEVRRGLIAAAGGLLRLPRLIPRNLAMELALTGRSLTAEEAWEAGLLNRLVDVGGALPAALDIARNVASGAPMSVATSKNLILHGRTWAESDMFDRQKPAADAVLASQDAIEGARAFVQKREPVWVGR
ncbi:crotonase/enoyl-CoA hydratase family protein [Paraburkholderia dilworthii]|uniref:crotonase/enoyl-CoA hydratase family protein n=1 Tax=Paraburkholderia dilworthii TaxID=948106 RepID=UPI00048823EF|nr:crotonase/enoyl-CoA hydratase family protein [Paraburkholderia dilworthii]